jgi:hypothetical protein
MDSNAVRHSCVQDEKIFAQLGDSKYVTHCPPDSVPPGPPIYDALIVGWGAYTHIPMKVRRIAFLQTLRQRALPHSPLLISFFPRITSSYDTVVYRTAKLCRLFLRGDKDLLNPGDRLEWRRFIHRFTREEVEGELRTAGFLVAHCSEENSGGHAVDIAE